jgi:hypothetical protein
MQLVVDKETLYFDDGLVTAASRVLDQLTLAVIKEEGSVAGANGLSIYLPAGNEAIASDYSVDAASFLDLAPRWYDPGAHLSFLELV